MVIHNINHFDSLISGRKTKKKSQFAIRTSPLFKVQASLSAPEIVISPLTAEVYKMTIKFARSIIETTKQFHRWQNGTCIFTPPQRVSEDEEPFVFSFYQDVMANPQMVQMMMHLNQSIVRSFGNLTKWLDMWRKYRPLWKVDKVRMALGTPRATLDY